MATAVAYGVAAVVDDVPQTYKEAMTSSEAAQWLPSMQREIASCEEQATWQLVKRAELPAGTNVLPVKWVFKKKTDENGALTVYKSRITPKGFRQKQGVDYHEVFASTGKYKTLRVMLSLAARRDMRLVQMDVPSAFVRADLEEEVFMEMPPGFEQPGMVCKLLKSLYGLKQSPRNWYKLLSSFIANELGWTACVSDPCLFWRRSASGKLMLLFVFVDDMQAAYEQSDEAEWLATQQQLVARFETKVLGDSRWMLGMRITRDPATRTIQLDQELYVTKALERYGLAQCKHARTPASSSHGAPDDERYDCDGGGGATDAQLYMEKVGTLLYAAISTRPDIGYAVHQLTRHMQAPLRRHMVAADRVLRYLAGTRTLGLRFGSPSTEHSSAQVSAFADADWGGDKVDRKSTTGWIARIDGDVVSWASKKQSAVALSTCEAELYAEAAAMQETQWLRGLLQELGLSDGSPALIYGDNQSAIAVTQNGVRSERTKHIDIRFHFVTDMVERGSAQLQWVPTQQQQADILTKALGEQQFVELRNKLMA